MPMSPFIFTLPAILAPTAIIVISPKSFAAFFATSIRPVPCSTLKGISSSVIAAARARMPPPPPVSFFAAKPATSSPPIMAPSAIPACFSSSGFILASCIAATVRIPMAPAIIRICLPKLLQSVPLRVVLLLLMMLETLNMLLKMLLRFRFFRFLPNTLIPLPRLFMPLPT